jgi:hypothetical protein
MKKKYFTEEEKKEARKKESARSYQKNKEKIKNYQKIYREKNKNILKIKNEEYHELNKEKLKKYRKVYNQNHKIERKKWCNENKDKVKLYNKKTYYKNKEKRTKKTIERLHIDINFKISFYLRNRLREAFKHNWKSGSAVKDLGCSIPELKTHLESKFQEGMSWDNYGFYGWHIDHIIPLASFDLSNREEFLKACHYTNLQPMWAKENWTKGKK